MKPQALIILDGFGYRAETDGNAIKAAHTPTLTSLLNTYPWTTLQAAGTAVGLMQGQPGNSVVGHFTLGAGTIIEQPLTHLTRLARSNQLGELPVIKKNFSLLAHTHHQLHLLCLASDGNVHNRLEHLLSLINIAAQYQISSILVHAILDGKDVAPKSAAIYLQRIQDVLDTLPPTTHGAIASIQGRLYAMDYNETHQSIKAGFDLLVHQDPHSTNTWQHALANYYQKGITDEAVPPTQLSADPVIKSGDGLIFINVRADRGRELMRLLAGETNLAFIITGIPYGMGDHIEFLIPEPHATDTLPQALAARGKSVLSIAESEKQAHVTYFINGNDETLLPHEKRTIIPSDDLTTVESNPRMQADTISCVVLESLAHDPRDFYIINYANADIVGHTGNFEATVKAVECLDDQLAKLYQAFVQERGGTLYITGDHGNAEDKRNNNSAHTTNPVYFIAVREPKFAETDVKQLTQLSDVKQFILKNLE